MKREIIDPAARRPRPKIHFALLTALAFVFTIGLTFASIEVPRLLDETLARSIDAPDVATGSGPMDAYKTELYLRHFHIRLIGWVCLGLVAAMIAAGFITGRSGWTSAGALVLFLPVFGHFAATMFFLGGLGLLRLLWLPFLDASFRLFRLGAIIDLPYNLLNSLYLQTGLDRRVPLSAFITGLGLLLFFLGTLTWFYARAGRKNFADLWIYRYSRHPQYLGWIVWSYGVMYLPGSNIKLSYELSNSLPWLLSTLIIIGVAMLEELKMKKAHGEAYESYRRRTPFLVPLPRFIASAFAAPLRLMFKKPRPERKREIAAVLAFFLALSLGGSAFYGGLVRLRAAKTESSKPGIDELVRVLKEAGNRAEKRRAAEILAGLGEPAVDPLIAQLADRDAIVRAYAATALGSLKSERAVSPLIALLSDKDAYVRRSAIESLGRTGSRRAIPALAATLKDPARETVAAARALGIIPYPDAVPPLIEALQDASSNTVGAAAHALGARGARETIEPLVRCLEDNPNCAYDAVGTALWKLGSERAVDAWIAGLKKGSWWYPRAFCAAELGRNKSEKGLIPLQNALKDESPEVRRAAVLALMDIRNEKSIAALKDALSDKDLEVRIYAREALKQITAISK